MDQWLMLRWRQVSWTFQHFNFWIVLRLPGARIADDRLLATDNLELLRCYYNPASYCLTSLCL